MKTPEELKSQALDESGCCGQCDFYCTTVDNPFGCQEAQLKTALVAELVAYTEQLESTIRQVSKALCGKENTTLEELLQAVSQLKSRLAQTERERDAAVRDLPIGIDCDTCKYGERAYEEQPCSGCKEYRGPWYPLNWEWRGVCEENTKEELT